MTTRKSNSSRYQEDDNYKRKRQKNNEAVKKCRTKSLENTKKTKAQIEDVKNKNIKLKGSIEEKWKEITWLNDIFEQDQYPERKEKLKEILQPLEKYREDIKHIKNQSF